MGYILSYPSTERLSEANGETLLKPKQNEIIIVVIGVPLYTYLVYEEAIVKQNK